MTTPLVAAFPETGLWPVLWNFDSDGPDGYYRGLLSTAPVGTVDLDAFMRAGWEDRKTDRWMSGPPAPEPSGLAKPSPAATTPTDPFAEVNSFPDLRWLILVSCNRPADVTAVLDWRTPLPHSVITAFLRSWEERFGAVPVQLDGAHVSLHVTAPPASEEQAARLLDEFNVAGGWQYEEDGVEAFRRRPRHVSGPDDMTPTLWQFWPANGCPEGFAVEDTRPLPPLEID